MLIVNKLYNLKFVYYSEEPTKMDRLVFDAVSECQVNLELFPNVYRWRHTVALYSPTERNAYVFHLFIL
jgi:hypothetical protein